MEALYLLIPLSIVIVFVAIWVFFSMSDSGQFDDMIGPALRVLQDDDGAPERQSADKNDAAPSEARTRPGSSVKD